MTGPLRLLTLVAGFLILYSLLFSMTFVTHTPWFWFSGMTGCLFLYLTGFITGSVKGWWKQ